ncbi:Carbohydrate esterase family 4 protein [Mycena kentingensis (nom. inval.)]|nr:Carbohydrate esterase family 4 protein [Mycena kentingensis (nom. inval.)]
MLPSSSAPAAAAASLLLLLAGVVRADGTEQSEAAFTGSWSSPSPSPPFLATPPDAPLADPNQECAPYSYGPVSAAMSASPAQFPAIWQPVSALLSSDSEGQAKYNAIKGNIPNIQPKGTLGVPDSAILDKYNGASDPDCWWTASTCTTPKASGVQPDVAAVPEPMTLGYGFDDGPNCSHNAFYQYLADKKQKATMFYVGSNVLDWPLQAQRAVADGHEICVHSWSHRSMTAFNNEQAFAELWYTQKAIKLVTGYTPTCWRPPLGDVDDRIRFIAQSLGMYNVLWKYNSNDWEVSSGAATPAEVQANYDALISAAGSGTFATAGAIILAHELNNYTMQTALDNYPKLASAFKHIVPVGVALNKTQPYAETNYTQASFAEYIGSASSSSTNSSSSSSSSGNKNSTSAQAAGDSGALSIRSGSVISATLVVVMGVVAAVVA